MQTHEWEALLSGTTPGPWEWHGGQDPDMRFIYGDGGGMCMTVEPVGSAYRDADPVLAAAAPEAVAEVIRLRKAIEDAIRSLRAPLCSHMPEGDELDEYLEEWEMQGYAAHILTCILEGDNHA